MSTPLGHTAVRVPGTPPGSDSASTNGFPHDVWIVRTGLEEVRRLGQAQAAALVARRLAVAEQGVRQAATETAAEGTRYLPVREDVEGWVQEQLEHYEQRLQGHVDAAEGRLAELIEKRVVQHAVRAEAVVERRLEGRADELHERGEAVMREAEARIREAEEKLSRRARRHELKLARLERNRRLASAERRLARRGEAIAAKLQDEIAEAESRMATLQRELEERHRASRPVRQAASEAPALARELQDVEVGLEADRRRVRASGHAGS